MSALSAGANKQCQYAHLLRIRFMWNEPFWFSLTTKRRVFCFVVFGDKTYIDPCLHSSIPPTVNENQRKLYKWVNEHSRDSHWRVIEFIVLFCCHNLFWHCLLSFEIQHRRHLYNFYAIKIYIFHHNFGTKKKLFLFWNIEVKIER